MSYQSDMVTAIKASGAMIALIGDRIFSDVAPDTTATPYIVYNVASTGGETTHDGNRNLEFPLVRFSCWAKTRIQAIALASALNNLLDGNTIAGSNSLSFTFSGQNADYDTETKLFSEIIEFQGACNIN